MIKLLTKAIIKAINTAAIMIDGSTKEARMQVLVVGAGFSGAVLAHELAKAGHRVTVIEARDHIGGNCYTRRCSHTGVMEHVYGPHIFHTKYPDVWNYITQFSTFRPYRHFVKASVHGGVYSLPINLHTINQFYNQLFSPSEARAFIESRSESLGENVVAQNLEEQAIQSVGPEMYKAFIKGYTEKQWGRKAVDLPASVIKRLPVRFDYNIEYFSHPFQAIPEEGYTPIFERLLDHSNVTLHLSTRYTHDMSRKYEHIFWTGALDEYFDYKLGRLPYRTLDFETYIYDGDFQGCAVMNYPDKNIPFTRVTEYQHFTPWETHDKSIYHREFPREAGPDDILYYPIRLSYEQEMLHAYENLAGEQKNITFLGRLGTYRYLDMDVSIRESLECARGFIATTS